MPLLPSNENGIPSSRSGQGSHQNTSNTHRPSQTPLVIYTSRSIQPRTEDTQPEQPSNNSPQARESVAVLSAQHVGRFDPPSQPRRPTSSLIANQASPTEVQEDHALELNESPLHTQNTHLYALQTWANAPERHEIIALQLLQASTTAEDSNQSQQEIQNEDQEGKSNGNGQ